MLVELGHFALILALLMSAAQAFFGLAGSARQNQAWLAVVPSAVAGQLVFLAVAGTTAASHRSRCSAGAASPKNACRPASSSARIRAKWPSSGSICRQPCGAAACPGGLSER